MFMFRSRKSNLVKRAWKARKIGVSLTNDQQLLQRQAEQQLKAPAMQLLRRLTESQLELLVAALESGGADTGECILVPRNGESEGGTLVGGERGVDGMASPDSASSNGEAPASMPPPPPHLLMMWLWRWPDLFHQHQLSSSSASSYRQVSHHHLSSYQPEPPNAALIQSLPCCAARNDHVYVCANPYHWARLLLTESPPPPYSRFNVDLLRPEDAAPSEDLESQETGGTYQYCSYSNNGPGTIPWCQVAYWEGRVRVGRLYPVRTPSLNIMGDIPHGEGLCLASLTTGSNYSPTEQSKKTKEKIGLGLVLYQEGGGVWVYNRSDIPLFVNSPTLDGGIHPRSNFNVHKLPPGHLINIFDYDKARLYQKLPLHPDLVHEGPIDQNSVRVSFAKGWGRNYHRQEITECPCWLEILLVPVR
ncbi:mothers against decapentaplegic homolog 6 isoform X2 [Palaemon carinicauda]|uniref:mothers against decapentaplegic homolog 6 isoform X2 n=1 Tax=Palaemon carinicauda TaxID=392227 RepID=UPI0035B63D1D